MKVVVALFCGALFGAGLHVSGMTDTAKVQGWLDLFGQWDPTLAFVLGGAILPMAVAWRVAQTRKRSLLNTPLPEASTPVIDRNLLTGSAFFGVGWALVGLCPGPALAVLGWMGWQAWAFFIAMAVGMVGWTRLAAPVLRPHQEVRP